MSNIHTRFKKGHKGYWLGKTFSAEHRERLRLAGLGKKIPEETKIKMGLARSGERNPLWKGEKVGYSSLHSWIRTYKPRPELCEICNIVPSKEVSNLSGKYLRDFTDWQWLCHRCHMRSDGRIEKVTKNMRPNGGFKSERGIKIAER